MIEEIGLDLQAFVKRVYEDVLYQSTFYNFLNPAYIGSLRQTGAPVIEVAKTDVLNVNVRETKEIQNALDPALVSYSHTMVDLTELPMDYSIRVPVVVSGSDIANAIQSAVDLEDSAIAQAIDTYGYGKLAAATGIEESAWAPATKEDYISALNGLRAKLFNKKITGDYRLGLGATEYANLVSALTSVLKFETLAGRDGVDMGEIARVYGISIFEINDNVIGDAIGYFFNPIAVVGDTFFSAFVQTATDIRYPGYYCISGNQMFGAEVVRPEAIIRLVSEVSA
jgi:hypothetical protein